MRVEETGAAPEETLSEPGRRLLHVVRALPATPLTCAARSGARGTTAILGQRGRTFRCAGTTKLALPNASVCQNTASWGLGAGTGVSRSGRPSGVPWWSIRASDIVGTVQLAARPLAKGVMIDAVDRIPTGSQATPRWNWSRRSTIPVFCIGERRCGGDRRPRGSR